MTGSPSTPNLLSCIMFGSPAMSTTPSSEVGFRQLQNWGDFTTENGRWIGVNLASNEVPEALAPSTSALGQGTKTILVSECYPIMRITETWDTTMNRPCYSRKYVELSGKMLTDWEKFRFKCEGHMK